MRKVKEFKCKTARDAREFKAALRRIGANYTYWRRGKDHIVALIVD